MKKQLISLICAGLIGISGVSRGTENGPKEAQDEALKADSAAAPINTATVQPKPDLAPILVPFNHPLFALFCETKKDQYWWGIGGKIALIVMGSAFIGSNLNTMLDGTYQLWQQGHLFKGILSKCSDYEAAFWKLPWYSKISNIFWTSWQSVSIALILHSTTSAIGSIGDDFDAYSTWKERDAIERLTQQKIWHEEIFNKLGRPIVNGTIPLVGKYWFKCIKANAVMHETFDFDPFNLEHVKQILFGNTDMRCSQIVVQIVDTI